MFGKVRHGVKKEARMKSMCIQVRRRRCPKAGKSLVCTKKWKKAKVVGVWSTKEKNQ